MSGSSSYSSLQTSGFSHLWGPLPSSIFPSLGCSDTEMMDILDSSPVVALAQQSFTSQSIAMQSSSALTLFGNDLTQISADKKNNIEQSANKLKRSIKVTEQLTNVKKLKLAKSTPENKSCGDIGKFYITPMDNDIHIDFILRLFPRDDQVRTSVLKAVTNLSKNDKILLSAWLESKINILDETDLIDALLLIANGQIPSLILSKPVQQF